MKIIPIVLTVLFVMVLPAAALDLLLVDADGEGLAGAHVSVVGQPGIWVADREGFLNLDPTPELPFVVIVARADGVALRPIPVVEIPSEGRMTLTVEGIGGTVTVIGSAVPDIELSPASATTLIGKSDIEERGATSLSDVLETVPGVGRTGEGHSVVPSLRGLPKHRTLIILDDGRVSTERRAGPSGTYLDPDTLDEVEAIRGPGSVAHGSDAFGGIIRARSRAPRFNIEGVEVDYAVQGAQGTPGWGAAADVTMPAVGGGFLLGAQVRDYADYSSPESVVLDTRWETWGVRAGWQGVVGKGVLQVGWRSDRSVDVGKPSPESHVKRVFYPIEDSDRLNIRFEQPLQGKWQRLSLSFAWDDYRLVLDKDNLDGAGNPVSRARSDTAANDFDLRFEAERSFGSARLVVGANVNGRYGLESTLSEYAGGNGGLEETLRETAIEEARGGNAGIFAALSGEVGRFRLSAGLRGDSVQSSNSGGYFGDVSTSDSDLAGYVAAALDLGAETDITLQLARGFRSPQLSDRYYRGITGRGFITGNPSLDPETSLQLDVAFHARRARWQLGGYAYLYRIQDLIERYKDDGNYFFRNRGEAEIRGMELEAALNLGGTTSLQLGAWWLRGEVLDDGMPMDDIPAPGLSVVLRDDRSHGMRWMLRGAAYARDDDPGPSELVTPGYAVLDAAAGWAFSDAVQLQLLGRNLLDRTYPGSADEQAVLAPGRSFMVTLRGTL